jgi:F-type H+-transporting ATPase subunit b
VCSSDLLLSKAKDEAKSERLLLLEEARKAASDLSSKQQEALKNDKQNLNQAISRRAQQEVFAIARKTLKDLAGTSLEERTVEVFVQKLSELKGKEKEELASALSAPPGQVLIRTAFDLPQAQRDLIIKTIKETLGIEIQTRFETAPALISGIDLTANGQKVEWSIADYLTSLEKGIEELLKEHPRSEDKAMPEPEPDESKPKKEFATNQESETKPESVAKQEINPEPKPT